MKKVKVFGSIRSHNLEDCLVEEQWTMEATNSLFPLGTSLRVVKELDFSNVKMTKYI